MIKDKAEEIAQWIASWIANEVNIEKKEVDHTELFVTFGLGSRQSVILAADIESRYNIEIDAAVAWSYPTIRQLSEHIADILKSEAHGT